MASQMQVTDLSGREVVKGPPKIDLLEAVFFDNSKTLQFRFADGESILGKAVGYIPCVYTHQTAIVIVEHYTRRGHAEMAFIIYDHSNRIGRGLKSSICISELLDHRR